MNFGPLLSFVEALVLWHALLLQGSPFIECLALLIELSSVLDHAQ